MGTTVFIGGGNMAGAILGGLRRAGRPAGALVVVDPDPATRQRIASEHGVHAIAMADGTLRGASTFVWAVKPQVFRAAAAAVAPHIGDGLQLSVMAGIRSDAIASATGHERIVRAMPNTPALIGQGISGLYARPTVGDADRAEVEAVLAPTGRILWLPRESDLDAVTALSGSGPAYVFYFAEAMVHAAVEAGLTEAQGRELALATFSGASALASSSKEALGVLRERVTSKGGTTHAALQSLQADHVADAFQNAIAAARERARELGDEFG
jgi:pyrroline-5-carboxylate reductase